MCTKGGGGDWAVKSVKDFRKTPGAVTVHIDGKGLVIFVFEAESTSPGGYSAMSCSTIVEGRIGEPQDAAERQTKTLTWF